MRATFTTTSGVKGRTSSERRYVVVARVDAAILYRTDDYRRASGRAHEASHTTGLRYSQPGGADVIDTTTGEVVRGA